MCYSRSVAKFNNITCKLPLSKASTATFCQAVKECYSRLAQYFLNTAIGQGQFFCVFTTCKILVYLTIDNNYVQFNCCSFDCHGLYCETNNVSKLFRTV